MKSHIKNNSIPEVNFGIDILRHLFAFAVVLQHMHSNTRYSNETNMRLNGVVDWIDGAVLGFFLISGYLYKYQENFIEYSKRQTARLMIPFFIFSVLYVAAFSILGKIDILNMLENIYSYQNVGMQLYFLPYLLITTISYSILSHGKVYRENKSAKFIWLAVLLVVSLLTPTIASTGSDYKLIPLYMFCFMLGVIYKIISSESDRNIIVLMTICGLLALGMLLDARFLDVALVTILLVFVVSYKINLALRAPGSGGVFLFHTPIVNYLVSIVLLKFGLDQGFNIVASVILTYLTCLAASWVIIKRMPKYKWLILE